MGNQPTTPLIKQALGGSTKYRPSPKATQARTPGFPAFGLLHRRNTSEPFTVSSVSVSVNVVYTLAEITVTQVYHNDTDLSCDSVFEFSVGDQGVLASLITKIDGLEVTPVGLSQNEVSEPQDLENRSSISSISSDTIEQRSMFKQLIGEIPAGKTAEVRLSYIVSLAASSDGWMLSLPVSIFPSHSQYVSKVFGRLDVGEEAQIAVLSQHSIQTDRTVFTYDPLEQTFGIGSEMVFAIKSKWMEPVKDLNAESSSSGERSEVGGHWTREIDSAGLLSGLLNNTWFDQQTLYHKTQILKFAKLLALFSGVHQSELTLYCHLYSTTTSVITAILVATHLEELMRIKAVLPSRLTEVGFGNCLFRFFDAPMVASGPNRKSTPVSASQLVEFIANELENCDRLFSNSFSENDASHPQKSSTTDEPNNMATQERATSSNEDPNQKSSLNTVVPPISASLKPELLLKIDDYVHLTLTTFLSFAQQYFTENHAGINPVLSSGDFKVIFPLVKDPLLSRPALMVLSALAIGDKLGQSPLLKDLMTLLNHSELQVTLSRALGDLRRSEHLSLYTDVLGTLRYVVSQNPNLKESLRDSGGFTWLLANMKIALSAWIPEDPVPTTDTPVGSSHERQNSSSSSPSSPRNLTGAIASPHLFLVLKELITTLGHCMKGNYASKEGFNWGWFTLNDMLSASTKLYEDPVLVVGLAEALLSITTISGWPAACSKHRIDAPGTWSPSMAVPVSEAVTSASSFMLQVQHQLQEQQRLHREEVHGATTSISTPITQSLAVVRKTMAECPSCKDALLIELPQAFKLIIDHLGRYTEVTSGISNKILEDLDPALSHDALRGSKIQKIHKDDVETAYIVILKSCKLLLDGNPANARILSSVGTCLHILTGLKALLLLENVTSLASSRQPLLLQLVEKIASYSISLAEFHKFIELLRVPTCPINFLQTLTTIASRTIGSNFSPQAFITIPKARDALVRSPSTHRLFSECKWPPKPGYTLNFWFSVDHIPEQASVSAPGATLSASNHSDQDLFRLLSIEASQDRKAASLEVLLTTRGFLHLRSSTDADGIVFDGFSFSAKNWYSVTIVHTRGPLPAKNTPKQVTSTISVWVNAVLTATGYWTMPESISTSNVSVTFGTSSRPYQPSAPAQTTASLGSSQPLANHAMAPLPTCASAWHLGNAIIFDAPLQSDAELIGLYILGPNYTGGFSGINLKDFAVHSLLNPSLVSRLSSETTQLLLVPEKINLHPLHEHIFYFLSSSEQLVACRPDSAPKPSVKSRSGDLEAFPAEFVGVDVTLATRLSVSDVIQYAGGASTLLYYFATAHHPDQQKLALKIFVAMTSWHAQNARELRENHGYLVIARVIRKMEWVLDEELLAIVFSLVGITMSTKRGSYSEGVVHNIDAFHALLLDWKVWKQAPNRIKLLLFRSLADLVSTSEHAAFNAWYLRQAGARTILLLLLEDPLFPYQLAQYVITAIAYLMNDPWTRGDMNAVLRYMIATHPNEPVASSPSYGLQSPSPASTSTASDCPLGVAHKLASFSGIQAHSIMVRFEMLATEEVDGFGFLDDDEDVPTAQQQQDALSDSISPRKRASVARLYPGDITFAVDPLAGPIRNLILSLVLEMLQKATPATILTFFSDICGKEVLLTLMQTPILSSRVMLLKILEVYIKHPALAAAFWQVDGLKAPTKGCNGFRILGEILRRYDAHDEILSVLFSMMFGKPISYHVLRTEGVVREGNEPSNNQIERPELATTLLTIITACTTERSKKHAVIQIIYDIALHSETAKTGFLQAALVENLCHLFVFELEHRIGYLSSTFRSTASKHARSDDEDSTTVSKMGDFETEGIRLKSGVAPNAPDAHIHTPPRASHPREEANAASNLEQGQTSTSSLDDAEDPYNYTIEQDILRFLRTLIMSKLQEGDHALTSLRQVLGVIRALPLPLAYVNALQKQVAYEVLELLHSFDFSSQPLYERMQKICTFVVNLMIHLERHGSPSTSKAYQLSRYSSLNLLNRTPSNAKLTGATPPPFSPNTEIPVSVTPTISSPAISALSSGGSTISRKQSRKVSFWEILDSFDSSDSPRDDIPRSPTRAPKKSSLTGLTTAHRASSSSTVDLDSDASHAAQSSSTEHQASDLEGLESFIHHTSDALAMPSTEEGSSSVFDSTNSGSETDGVIHGIPSLNTSSVSIPQSDVVMVMPSMVDLTTEEFSIVTRRAWSSGDFLIEDKQLVDLIFKVFDREVDHRKATTSAFKKFGEALRHKMVGVTSLGDIELNVSWHVERLLFHIIKDRPIVSPKLVEFALAKVSSITIPGAFLSETEFLSRFMKYSSRLLGGSSANWVSSAKQPMSSTPELAAATLSCWKSIISSTASRVMSKVITMDTLKLVQDSDGSNPILPSSIHWSDGLVERIQRIENVDVLLRREWSKQHKLFADEYVTLAVSVPKVMREVTRRLSDRYLKKVEGLLKPSLKMVEQQMQVEKYIRHTWKEILSTVTHERAAWPIQRSLLRWELDPTEGPLRTRVRLMPVYAHRHPIIGGEGYRREKYSHDPKDVYLTTDLDAKKVELLKSLENQLNEQSLGGANASLDDETPVPSHEHVVKYFPCSHITPFHKRDGELVIGQMNAYFIDSHQFKDAEEAKRKYTSVKKHSTWPYDEIKEIHKRRHLLINNALEIFLIKGRTYLLSFRTTKDRDMVYDMLIVDRRLPNFVNYESEVFISGKWTKMSITDKWRKGLITNFEYLMHLNTLSGRTYNDLTQYPVFPYILRDYTSHILQLDNAHSFREFDLPMGAQDPQRLLKFIEKYEALLDLQEDKPYFYGSHYSNVGTVLHFLIRLEPFSQYFIEFQSGRFDVPDRVFHSVGQSWDLSSSQSQSDVKELIPEFFYLPEFLRNANRFKFGAKQDGTKVDDVVLPTWSQNSARTFILLHMEALESEYVSFHLHQWIDLIFGYRQLGEEAVVARNQFHPYTYEGNVDISKITDPIERDAIITQINSYGQTPTQLFKVAHPKRSEHYQRASNPDGIHVTPHRLQVFPALPWAGVRKLHFHNGTPVALGSRQELLWPAGTQYLQWGNWDGSLRAINLKTKQVDFEAQLFTSFRDRLTCVDVAKDGRVIVAGSESGLVRIWQKTTQTHINKKRQSVPISTAIATRTKSRPPAPATSPAQAIAAGLVLAPTPLTFHPGTGLTNANSTPPSSLSATSSTGSGERLAGHNTSVTPVSTVSSSTPNTPTHTPTPPAGHEMPAKIASSVSASIATANSAASVSAASLEFTPSAILSGHSVDVTCIKASSEQSIIVSGSKDGSVILWDANRLKFIRTLLPSQPANNPVTITHIEVLAYTSEIVIIEDHLVKGTSSIVLCSVNGEKIASRSCSDKIGAVAVTHEKPGLVRNIIITGHSNGDIKFWSAFDLAPIRTLDRTQQVPVTALCVSDDFGCLFAGHASTGVVTCHAAKPARFIS